MPPLVTWVYPDEDQVVAVPLVTVNVKLKVGGEVPDGRPLARGEVAVVGDGEGETVLPLHGRAERRHGVLVRSLGFVLAGGVAGLVAVVELLGPLGEEVGTRARARRRPVLVPEVVALLVRAGQGGFGAGRLGRGR